MTALLPPNVELIDTLQFGLPGRGAVYLLKGALHALVDTGTAASAPGLLSALRGIRLDHVFVTHLHQDHAGGAGHLATAYPACRVWVHPVGVEHLAEPSSLLDAVRVASPDLFPHYGHPFPVPRHQLVAAHDGDVCDLGNGLRIEVIASPGHARHHLCFFEHTTGVLFTGDALGGWNHPVSGPHTVPPRYDVPTARMTLERLLERGPKWLAYAHFGIRRDAIAPLRRHEAAVLAWLDRVHDLFSVHHSSHDVLDSILSAPENASLSIFDKATLALCVRGAIATLRHEQRLPFEASAA